MEIAMSRLTSIRKLGSCLLALLAFTACRGDRPQSSLSQLDASILPGESVPTNPCSRPTITLDPPLVGPGGLATLAWNLPGYVSVRGENGLFPEVRGPVGSFVLRGGPSRILRLIAEPANGGPDAIFEIPFRAENVGGDPKILSFGGSKPFVAINELTYLRWVVSGCSSIEIRGPGGWLHGAPCRLGEDIVGVALPESGVYTLTIKDSFNTPLTAQTFRLEVR